MRLLSAKMGLAKFNPDPSSVCLILFSYQPTTDTPLVVTANRDEFYARPAAAAHYWPDLPHIFAGRDLSAQGTWLGVSKAGRFAAVTNFSAGDPPKDYPASRGELVAGFLSSQLSAADYVRSLAAPDYAGYNLLLFDGEQLLYTTNKDFPDQFLAPGCYGLSNAELGANWPKCIDGTSRLLEANPVHANLDQLLEILADQTPPSDDRIPDRSHLAGAPIEERRRLAARFIASDEYGTRATTVVRISKTTIDVCEQSFERQGKPGSAVFARMKRDKERHPAPS